MGHINSVGIHLGEPEALSIVAREREQRPGQPRGIYLDLGDGITIYGEPDHLLHIEAAIVRWRERHPV